MKAADSSKNVFYSDRFRAIPLTKLSWLTGPRQPNGKFPMFIMRRDVRYSQIFWRLYRRTPGAPDKLLLLLHAAVALKQQNSNESCPKV